ncbi:MAG: nuclear transport factor 2 family protein [Candidatus Dormibacteria bacterium]
MRADDDVQAAVIALLDEFTTLVSDRNVDGVCGLFLDDPDVTYLGSEPEDAATGPKQLRELMTRVLKRPQTYVIRWQTRLVSARGDAAWVAADTMVHVRIDDLEWRGPYRVSVIVEYRGGRWLIAHFHGSEPSGFEPVPPEG